MAHDAPTPDPSPATIEGYGECRRCHQHRRLVAHGATCQPCLNRIEAARWVERTFTVSLDVGSYGEDVDDEEITYLLRMGGIDAEVIPMPDPSPDTPSVYAPRCGHHGNPLTWLGDDHRWRCPDCFPELFPTTPAVPGSSSPDTAALNDWNIPMTPHPDTEPMLPRDPAATVDKAYDERDVWVETARMYAQNSDYWRDRFHDLRHNLGIRAFTAPDEDENVMLASLDARIMSALADAERLKTALRLTAEYVGPELLPPIEGWSWYDALEQS